MSCFTYLESLSVFYPKFNDWYKNKVIPGVLTGERKIIERRINGVLAGVAITKNTKDEKKLCCLRVLPDFVGSGVGLRLFEDAFLELNTDKPLLSVSEEQIAKFERFFCYFGFEKIDEYFGLYRPNKLEFSFNGLLVKPAYPH